MDTAKTMLQSCDKWGRLIFHYFGRLPPELQVLVWEFAYLHSYAKPNTHPVGKDDAEGLALCFLSDLLKVQKLTHNRRTPHASPRGKTLKMRGGLGRIQWRYPLAAHIQENYTLMPKRWTDHYFDRGISLQPKSVMLPGNGSTDPVLILQRVSGLARLLQTCYLSRLTVLEGLRKTVKERLELEITSLRETKKLSNDPEEELRIKNCRMRKKRHEMVLAVIDKMLEKTKHHDDAVMKPGCQKRKMGGCSCCREVMVAKAQP